MNDKQTLDLELAKSLAAAILVAQQPGRKEFPTAYVPGKEEIRHRFSEGGQMTVTSHVT